MGGVSEKFQTCSDTFLVEVFSHRFNETGENTRAVWEVTNFPYSPLVLKERQMYIIDEKDKEYRFGDSGPKYLVQGPRMNFAIVQFMPGQDFHAHYHEVMEENFYILEGNVTIVVNGEPNTFGPGQLIHIEPLEVHYLINNSSSVVRMVASLAPFQQADKIEVDNPVL